MGLRYVQVFWAAWHYVSAVVFLSISDVGTEGWFPVAFVASNMTDIDSLEDAQTLIPAPHKVSVILLVAVAALISGTHHLMAAWHYSFYIDITGDVAALRWIDYALSSPLLIVALAIQCGDWSVQSLAAIAGLQASCILLGAGADMTRSAMPVGGINARVDRILFWAGCIPFAIAVSSVCLSLQKSDETDSSRDIPAFVWAIIVYILSMFSLFGVVAFLFHYDRLSGPWSAELWYNGLSGTAKTGIQALVFAGATRASTLGALAGGMALAGLLLTVGTRYVARRDVQRLETFSPAYSVIVPKRVSSRDESRL